MVGEFVLRCFHARTVAHILHLKSRSYAHHIALNEFYDGIIPLIDSFAEAYQGQHGLVQDYDYKFRDFPDGLTLLDNLGGWIAANRAALCEEKDTHLQNIVDEIVALIQSTTYKLRFLR